VRYIILYFRIAVNTSLYLVVSSADAIALSVGLGSIVIGLGALFYTRRSYQLQSQNLNAHSCQKIFIENFTVDIEHRANDLDQVVTVYRQEGILFEELLLRRTSMRRGGLGS
jgi:hypothetical protein